MKIGEIDDGVITLLRPTSLNNRLIVQAYKNQGGLKSTVQHGIAMVVQKVNLAGLTVLVEAKLTDGTVIPKGSKAYIKEARLHSEAWAKALYESENIEGQFIIADLAHVEMIVPPKEENI